MINTEQILEFNKIKDKLKEFVLTQNASNKIDEMSPIMSETELMAALRDTTEAKLMVEKFGNPPISSMQGINEMVSAAEKGGCLTADQLEKIGIMLTSIKRLKDYLCRCKQLEISIPYYEDQLDSMEEVRNQINIKIRSGEVDDNASSLLKSLRADIDRTEQKMREKADSVMRANKDSMSDSFSTMRNGHICIPVKKECKIMISGSVIDKSSTGSTYFMEPAAVTKFYEELQNFKIDEENEVMRILYELSGMLADSIEIINQNTKMIEKLDFLFAKGKLSLEYDGTEPKICNERRIKIVNGRHPLMDRNTNVPLNFEIGNNVNGIIITGPNTGGKTVCIKTVALNCMMAQCGLHVDCEEAEICMNDAYLCDIGDGQNISENLSTFSSHIKNVLDILQRAGKDSLVIMDELGSGTDPTEGMGIAVAVLQELKKSKALYLVTTHYPEIKNYADKTEGVINARMSFDKESLKPLYNLVIGEAGESCAFYIAERLGMPVSMLKEASRAAYGRELDSQLLNSAKTELNHVVSKHLVKRKIVSNNQEDANQFNIGDSVMIYPDKRIGIVCKKTDEKGVLQVQLSNKKIYINHKRVKLHVKAEKLYPEDYDFSIIFNSVEQRKLSHAMDRKFVDGVEINIDN